MALLGPPILAFGAPSAPSPKAATIRGTVTGYDGVRLAQTRVVAFRMVGDSSQPGSYTEEVASATTGKRGDYALSLPQGTYRIGFFPSNTTRYAFEYYSDQPTAHSASQLTVGARIKVPAVDAVLEPAASVSGRVVDDLGAPLAGIEVILLNQWPSQLHDVMRVTTGADGKFSFGGLPANEYGVWAEDPSFTYVNNYDTWEALAEGESLTGLEIAMSHGGRIEGHVTDENGDPVARMGVAVGVEPYFWDHVAWTETDEEGFYRFVLPEGDYRVNFVDWNDLGYINEWYNDSFNGDDGLTVPVAVGQPALGIDAEVQRGATVSGHVSNAAGTSLAGISVTANTPNNGEWPNWVDGTDTDENGDYSLTVMPGTEVLVEFEDWTTNTYLSEWYNDAGADFSEATAVVATLESPATDIDAVLAEGAHIVGRISDPEGVGIQGIGVTACDVPANPDDWPPDQRGTQTDDSGAYDLLIEPGTYLVRFEDWERNEFLGEWYSDAGSWQEAESVTTAVGSPATGVDAQLERGALISGRVTDGVNGIPGVQVNANVTTGNQEDPYRGVNSCETGQDGTYQCVVPPGEYLVEFQDFNNNMYLSEWYGDVTNWYDASPVTTSVGAPAEYIDAVLQLGAHIRGGVTAPDGGVVQGAWVTAVVLTGDPNQPFDGRGSNSTDEYGRYDLLVPPGTYRIQFNDWDLQRYLTEWYDNVAIWEDSSPVPTSVEVPAENIDAQLAVASFIEGHVSGPGGAAAGVVHVGVAAPGEQPWMMDFRGGAELDPEGNYRIAVAPGTYYINFSPDDWSVLANEWYDDAFVGQLGTPVVVGEAETVSDINAALSVPGIVTGRVTDAAGNGIPNVQVVNAVDGVSSGEWWWFNNTLTNAGGFYTLYCKPGLVKIGFMSPTWGQQWYPGAGWPGGAVSQLVVEGGTLSGIDAVLVPAGP